MFKDTENKIPRSHLPKKIVFIFQDVQTLSEKDNKKGNSSVCCCCFMALRLFWLEKRKV